MVESGFGGGGEEKGREKDGVEGSGGRKGGIGGG